MGRVGVLDDTCNDTSSDRVYILTVHGTVRLPVFAKNDYNKLSRNYRMLRQSDSEEMEEAVEWIPPFKDELSMD